MKTITLKQYMNKEVSPHEYYSQFVTEQTKKFVLRKFGIAKLKASKCEYLNDLCKHSLGGTWIWDFSPVNEGLIREAGECCSPSTKTCVGKAAARILLKEDKEASE